MTIELVDGRAGKPHINGDDLGDFKAGILGDEGYVFDRGNTLAATLNDANSVTIDTGSGIMPISGRHFRVTSPENATITSGTQDQNRNDLIVLRPTTATDDTTVESVAVVVLRGTPTDGSAADPETEDTDLVLYRIQLTGVSVADPIALFSVMVPYNKFRTSIDPIKIRTRRGVQFNQSGQQPITSLSGFTDIDNDLIISVIPSIAGASSSSLQAKALWNTLDGNNDLQIVTGVSQSVYVNVTVIYLVS